MKFVQVIIKCALVYQKGKDASHCYDYEKKWENWVPGAGETFIFLFLTSENVSAVKSSGYAPNQMGIKMKFFVLLFLFPPCARRRWCFRSKDTHNDDTMPASYNLKMALGIFQNQSMIIHREHFWFHPKVLIIKRIGRNLQKTII